MSRSWANGSTRAWRSLRAAVLAANRATNAGRCTLALDGRGGRTLYPEQPERYRTCPRHGRACAAPCTRYAAVVHHVRGRARTGDDPRHLAAVCAACNGHVGDPSATTSTVAGDPAGRSVTRW